MPHIVFELTDEYLRQMDSSAEMVCDCLKTSGYRLYRAAGNEFISVDTPVTEQCNVFCTHESQLSHVI